jgi:hypothetical protein
MEVNLLSISIKPPIKIPKNRTVEINFDWDIEYKKLEAKKFNFICNIKAYGEFSFEANIEGEINTEKDYKDIPEFVSVSIIENLMKSLSKLVSYAQQFTIEESIFINQPVSLAS